MLSLGAAEATMKYQKAKDIAFGIGVISSMLFIASIFLGAFYAAETFLTQYSVFAKRPPYTVGR
jgi:hypothetical protein